jgi:hypothetical protein
MTNQPTDTDRARATAIADTVANSWGATTWPDAIAQALADERHRTLAPVLAACDAAEQSYTRQTGRMHNGEPFPALIHTEAIRRAAGQQP